MPITSIYKTITSNIATQQKTEEPKADAEYAKKADESFRSEYRGCCEKMLEGLSIKRVNELAAKGCPAGGYGDKSMITDICCFGRTIFGEMDCKD